MGANVWVKDRDGNTAILRDVIHADHTPAGVLSITRPKADNKFLAVTVPYPPYSWEWYEWQYDDPAMPRDPRGRIVNPTLQREPWIAKAAG